MQNPLIGRREFGDEIYYKTHTHTYLKLYILFSSVNLFRGGEVGI
jgi:hypothetical protein